MSEQLGFDFTERPEERPADRSKERPTSTTPAQEAGPHPEQASSLAAEVRELERITASHPLERKLLVGSTHGEGRELLRQLTRAGTPWVGWEPATPTQVALEIAASGLGAMGRSVMDGFRLHSLGGRRHR